MGKADLGGIKMRYKLVVVHLYAVVELWMSASQMNWNFESIRITENQGIRRPEHDKWDVAEAP